MTPVRIIVFIALLGSACVQPDRAAGQTPPVWGNLEPGPYAVGYRVESEMDRSRGYRPAVDRLGRTDSTETSRPMQISIWYPADDASTGRAPMTVGDYVRLQAGALGPEFDTHERRLEVERALTSGPLSPYFEGDIPEEDLARVLATPMAAVRGARPADGRFPVVIHGGASLAGQTVLLEYLSSHGFVVLSVPLLGTAPVWFGRGQGTPEYYQAGADDVGFLHAYAHELEFADASRTAMIGMFSAFGLLYQMQHMQLGALAALDGSYPPELREVPGFDSVAVRIPILDVPRSNPTNDRSILDGLRYAERYLARLEHAEHGDFYQFRRIAQAQRAGEDEVYEAVALTTRQFLEQVLEVDESPGESTFPVAATPVAVDIIPATRPSPPTAEEFLLLIRHARFAEARRVWKASDCSDTPCTLAPEEDMTITLLFLRRDIGAAASLEGFKLLTEMFPASSVARRHLQQTTDAAANE